MGINVKGKVRSVMEGILAIVILFSFTIAVYPMLTEQFDNLNTTFDNTFTNFLAGASGIISLMISIGLGLMGLYWIIDTFFVGKTGK